MKRTIDLHTHTTYSDGELTPLELLHFCHAKNIGTLAITDHNNIEGSKNAILVNPYADVRVISGIEFSADYELKGGELHILGYNMNSNDFELNDITKRLNDENIKRNEYLLYLLKKYEDISFSDQDIADIFSKKGNVGKPEVAKLLVKHKYAITVREAFDNIINRVKDKLPKREVVLTARDCIGYIKGAGGITSIAHAITLKKEEDDLIKFIGELKGFGLDSIEVFHTLHDAEYSKMLLKIVKKYDMLYSCGSDFHGRTVSPNSHIGIVGPNKKSLEWASILSKIKR